MDLDGYLRRIGVTGRPPVTLAALAAIHRAHLAAIPYENLDIHLGRAIPLGAEPAYRKLVGAGRGGWCYEMNGLLGWGLEALGFRVEYLAGTVGRDRVGDAAQGNHLLLLVHLDRPYLADVGFGDGLIDPVPLAEGAFQQAGFGYRLDRDADRWVFRNHPLGGAPSFDFTLAPQTLGAFEAQCRRLQTAPESSFVQHTICQRWTGAGFVSLRGAVLREITPDSARERDLADQAEFQAVLADRFSLTEPELAALWAGVHRRHQAFRSRSPA